MNDCVRYRFCYGTFGIIRQFFSMITLFPPFLPGIVPHKRYGILQLADYEPSGTTSSIASPKPLGISKPFHRVQNMRDCCTGDSLANNAPVFVKLPFLVTWTFGVMGGRQSSVRTAFWTSRPQRLICNSRRSYIPAAVPPSLAETAFHPEGLHPLLSQHPPLLLRTRNTEQPTFHSCA